MDITLFKAAENVRDMLDQIDPESGELPDGFEQARAVVATKASAVAAYMIEAEKHADMLEVHAKDVLVRVKAQRKRVEWLRQYLATHMAAAGITEIRDERGLFSAKLGVARDKSVDVFDADQLPRDYLREIPARFEPDKVLIRKAIEDGFDVPGAKLIARDRLTLK